MITPYFGGFVSAAASLLMPFIMITIQLMIAFVILVWFSLSLIYAAIKIIDYLLGQPFVGWLITGDINASNDLEILTKHGMFSFSSPIMTFLYVGVIISLFLFIVYFLTSLLPFTNHDVGSGKTRISGILMICLSFIWIPFLYSLLAIVTNGLMIGLLALLKIKKNTTSSIDWNILKENTISNLSKLNELLTQLDFKYVDLDNEEVQAFLNQNFNSQNRLIFSRFVELWNDNFANEKINSSIINNWINTLNSINLDKLNSLNQSQINSISSLTDFSNVMYQMNSYLKDINLYIPNNDVLLKFNNLFLTSASIDLSTFNIKTEILSSNEILTDKNISDICSYILFNRNYTDMAFSQSLVNIIYSLILGKEAVFNPGWDYSASSSFNIIGMIPIEITLIFQNITLHLSYIIKMLAIGGVVNSLLLPAIYVFALVLLRRFVYIAFWPIMILIAYSRNQGENQVSKKYLNELFYKTINIVAFGILWNFISVLTISIFNALEEVNIFKDEIWIKDILSIFVIIGIIMCSFAIIKTFLSDMEQDRSVMAAGASEVNSAKKRIERETKGITNKAKGNFSRANKSFQNNQNLKNFKTGWNSVKGHGLQAKFIAGKMTAFGKGSKK